MSKEINIKRMNMLYNSICEKKHSYETINNELKHRGLLTINGLNVGVNKRVSGCIVDAENINKELHHVILVCVQGKIQKYNELIERLSLNSEDLNFVEEQMNRL